ncbi:MAG: hypothetical protein M3R63_04455 [Actinomycetota bacterium]|nr:hypothetical protein [Actinomycetota bacterium]
MTGSDADRPDEPPTTVRCRTIDGTAHTLQLSVVGDAGPTGAYLPARMVSVDGGPALLQKWVPRMPSGEPGPLTMLDREIQATHRFALLFPRNAYPLELPRLRYYDVDSEEPSMLLEPYRGAPVAEVQQLSAQDRYRLQVGLLRALRLVGVAGMTHGRVDLDTLRWDAATRAVQLVGFERATPIGDRSPGAAGGEPADIRDDVWDAGLAIWRTAYPAHDGRGAPDLTVDGGALSALLAGVFVDPPAARPTPGELLSRLREPTQVRVVDLASPLRASEDAFDKAVQRKRGHRKEEQARASSAQSRWTRLRTALTSPASRPPTAETAPPALVRCPVCLDSYPRPDDELWRQHDGQYHQDSSDVRDPLKVDLARLNSYRRCPNPSQDTAEHYLPANYHAYDPPLVVTMIGRPTAGKTHLLAAMIREVVERGGLTPYGLTATPLDLNRHDAYRKGFLEPTEHGVQLPETPERLTDPVDILLIRGRRGTRPLAFFDVAGEDLQAVGDGELARFLIGTNAVIFVHGLEPTPQPRGNQALEMSLARLRAVPDVERLPAAIVATKSDRLRYHPPVDQWLRRERDRLAPLNAEQLHWESRDVFAFLHHRQEHAVLAPFSVFDRCTLHFASASGCDASPDGEVFARGFEPSRALRPLVAILAMAGMIEDAQARLVGT